MSEEGLNKAAILIMSLGEEEAVEVFKFLGPKEVQQLGTTMAQMSTVNRERVYDVLKDFQGEAQKQAGLSLDADKYLRTVLTKALGAEKATAVIDRILQGNHNDGIDSLKWMDASSVAELIKNEHPQIIATILVYLENDQASEIIKYFSDRLRNDVMLRIATLDGVQPMALQELNDALKQILSGKQNLRNSTMGGVKVAANILNYMSGTLEAGVIANIREYDAELAQQVQDEMFVFENLLDIDDRGIQQILREVQSEVLIIALKGTSQELRNKLFKNMSQRAAEMLKEDLDAKGPVRLSEVEAAQKEILKMVRSLADQGQIVMGGKGGEEGLVE